MENFFDRIKANIYYGEAFERIKMQGYILFSIFVKFE